ncbi:hypothetical protein [Mariniluteicoccus flavus]
MTETTADAPPGVEATVDAGDLAATAVRRVARAEGVVTTAPVGVADARMTDAIAAAPGAEIAGGTIARPEDRTVVATIGMCVVPAGRAERMATGRRAAGIADVTTAVPVARTGTGTIGRRAVATAAATTGVRQGREAAVRPADAGATSRTDRVVTIEDAVTVRTAVDDLTEVGGTTVEGEDLAMIGVAGRARSANPS